MPEAVTALVHVVTAIVVLLSFHGTLAMTTTSALIAMLLIYGLFVRRFFRLNSALNEVSEV